ncbi:site-specific integrase [Aldersonia kunmingensis]|uniref:site-specific integrase n=1 Tax=Aldersonia kunmingensis TaxID=408066 RepID=UPI00083188F5|nr:tyrosine-type recombinase/integrase [Aldersonia kunmingensis]
MPQTDSDDPDASRPEWFAAFISDCGTRKPSPHTLKAYRQDFDAIAPLLAETGSAAAELSTVRLTTDDMRRAFAAYAKTHEAASIRRCWSSWNMLCTFLFTAEAIPANPMPAVGRPKASKVLPKAFDSTAITALLDALQLDGNRSRSTDWPERDRALVLTALLTGMRSEEMVRTNIGDVRVGEDGSAVLHVHGKGNKDRFIPVERALLTVIERYLETRYERFPPPPNSRRRRNDRSLAAWPRKAALFVGPTGERITRGILQYRVQRIYRRAGIEAHRPRGALVHALRHTYATALADENISVYTLMKLLGHESLATAQRYVAGAGIDTRPAAARNPVYRMLGGESDITVAAVPE